MLVRHTHQCWCVTHTNAGASHAPMLVRHTHQCWCVTRTNAGVSDDAILHHQTMQRCNVTRCSVATSLVAVLQRHSLQWCNVTRCSIATSLVAVLQRLPASFNGFTISGLLEGEGEGAMALLLFRTFAMESIHLINSDRYENKNHVRDVVRGDPLARVRGG
jgi:hypothetical protein